jgi:hypothetical protein
VPNEAAAACAVLCNCVEATLSVDVDDARVSTLCASGLPATLHALLDDASALLSPAQEDMEALAPVT